MGRHTRQVAHDSPRRKWGGTGLLVLAATALVLLVVQQNFAPPADLPPGSEQAGSAPANVHQDTPEPAPARVDISHPELVANNDGSATLSASLATTGNEVALVGVQIVHQGTVQEISSTDRWLPVISGIDTIVGAASDAGGFTVPSGLTAGNVADVSFIFTDQTCVTVEAHVVPRTARHKAVFPKHGSQLDPATEPPDSLTSTCSDPVTGSNGVQS